MIDVRESFWSIPEEEWPRLWVRVRWRDFSLARPEPSSDTECVNLAELAGRRVDASFGFRSLTLYGKDGCEGASAVSPLLLDLDLDDDTQEALDALLERANAELSRRQWSHRVFRSGIGYHVEIDPVTIEPYEWCLDSNRARKLLGDIASSVDGRGVPGGGRACIDVPHDMVRMVGSAHRGGGHKELVQST